MKIMILIFVVIILLVPLASWAAGTIVVEAIGAGVIYEDNLSGAPLPKGCLVQIVLDRDGDGLDPLDVPGSCYPVGDDVLLPVVSGNSTVRIGDGLPPFEAEGRFSTVLTFDNEDPAPNYSGSRIYVRYWNTANPELGSMYGEAGPYILESGLKPEKINIVGDYDLYPTKALE